MNYDTMTMKGKKFVLVPQDEFKRLTEQDQLPPFPPADQNGNFPALAATRVSIARRIINDRKRAGLTQKALAAAADIRVETLNRIEKGRVSADTATIVKIDRALKNATRASSRKAV